MTQFIVFGLVCCDICSNTVFNSAFFFFFFLQIHKQILKLVALCDVEGMKIELKSMDSCFWRDVDQL